MMESSGTLNPLSLDSIIMEESQNKGVDEFEIEIGDLPLVSDDTSEPKINLFDASEPKINLFDESEPKVNLFDESEPKVNLFDESEPKINLYDESEPKINLFDFNEPPCENSMESLPSPSSSDNVILPSNDIPCASNSEISVKFEEESILVADEKKTDIVPEGVNPVSDLTPDSASGSQDVNDVLVEEEQAISLEDILTKSKDKADEMDDEFDFDLPANSSEQSKNKSDEITPDKNVIVSSTLPQTSSKPSTPPNIESRKKYVVMPKVEDSVVVKGNQSIETKQDQTIEQSTTEHHISGMPVNSEVSDFNSEMVGHGVDNKALYSAKNEWENVQTIVPEFVDENERNKKSAVVTSKPLLSFYEFEQHFSTCDFSSVKGNIKVCVERSGFSALKHFFFGPPKLHQDLQTQRQMIFCIAASALQNNVEIHAQALQTIYRSLTGSRFDCNRYGSHWEEIGFQGTDPATDLRAVGLLGLLNLIYLLRDPQKKVIAQDIYKISLHPTQNFPFCLMSINMSRIALQALREDCLNRECNRRKDVLAVVNDFYTAIYLKMYQIWKSKGKTIADSGFVIKEVEAAAKKNPQAVLKNLEETLARKKSSVNLENMDLGGHSFLSVVDTDAGQY